MFNWNRNHSYISILGRPNSGIVGSNLRSVHGLMTVVSALSRSV